jgi:hypothetical protein
MNLGDVPSWFAAIGTVGALAVSLLLLRMTLNDRKAERNDRRMAQAHLVAAWLHLYEADTQPYPELRIRIRNGSELPIYAVALNINVGVRGTFVRQPGAMAPGETRELRVQIPAYPRLDVRPSVAFTDAAGNRWLRTSNGQIKEPSVQENVEVFQTSPGAYASYEDHPTFSLGSSREEEYGMTVDR